MHPVPVSAAGSTRTAYGSEPHHVRPSQQFWHRVRKKNTMPCDKGASPVQGMQLLLVRVSVCHTRNVSKCADIGDQPAKQVLHTTR